MNKKKVVSGAIDQSYLSRRQRVTLRFGICATCLFMLGACAQGPEPCSAEWNTWVEEQLGTGDGQGHGPDVGSGEWQSV